MRLNPGATLAPRKHPVLSRTVGRRLCAYGRYSPLNIDYARALQRLTVGDSVPQKLHHVGHGMPDVGRCTTKSADYRPANGEVFLIFL